MKTVLITGANRGIGLHLAKLYLEKGYRVVAACRDPSKMPDIGGGAKFVSIKLDQSSKTDARQAAEELKGKGIEQIDILLANAAVNLTNAHFRDLDIDDMQATFDTNVKGPLILFQAFLPLLPKGGKFAVVSSGAGTIGQKHRPGQGAYGQSKAAVNFMIAKMNVEQPDHVILAINPGWVQTDMGNQGAKWNGMEQAPLEATFTCPQMIDSIERATKDNYSGKMIEYDGSTMAW